jgi:hypothetical protein
MVTDAQVTIAQEQAEEDMERVNESPATLTELEIAGELADFCDWLEFTNDIQWSMRGAW